MENLEQHYYRERDLKLIAYLLCVPEIAFKGTEIDKQIIYFLFEPYEKTSQLVSAYFSNQSPPIQPRILLESLENARTIIFRAKDEARAKNDM